MIDFRIGPKTLFLAISGEYTEIADTWCLGNQQKKEIAWVSRRLLNNYSNHKNIVFGL